MQDFPAGHGFGVYVLRQKWIGVRTVNVSGTSSSEVVQIQSNPEGFSGVTVGLHRFVTGGWTAWREI